MGRSTILIFLLAGLLSLSNIATAQNLHKHFEIIESAGIDLIELNVSTKAGRSFLNAVDASNPLLIMGASENDVAASKFKIRKVRNVQTVDAELACKSHVGLNYTESMAGRIFSDTDDLHDVWQFDVSEHAAFNMNLSYLMGEANVDLSRLSIKRLKINSGSADVKLSYNEQMMNRVAMDTFFVKVNFGNIDVKDLNCARARDIIAEVGFGSLSIDCGSDWKMNSRVNASVGAGNMNIKLPPNNIPVIIRIQDSPLCHITMAKSFKKIGENAYGNDAYRNNPDQSMEFTLDVGMGSIVFTDR